MNKTLHTMLTCVLSQCLEHNMKPGIKLYMCDHYNDLYEILGDSEKFRMILSGESLNGNP